MIEYCGKCSKKFSTKYRLKQHRSTRHGYALSMSLPDFLEELSRTPRKWGLNREGRLVFDGSDVCPISAVAGFLMEGAPYSEAEDYNSASTLNLSQHNAGLIIRAADSGKSHGRLRDQLLVACGIYGDQDQDTEEEEKEHDYDFEDFDDSDEIEE
jgi:hypothetical protein